MKIVLTGKMTQTRDKMYNNFDRCGITVMKAVSGRVDYLVTGERPGQSKIYDAQQTYNTEIVTEEQFNKILAKDYPEYLL